MTNKITVLKKNVEDMKPVLTTMDAGLEAMQKIVGGYIECVRFHSNIDLWINEEGLLIELPLNFITIVIEDGLPRPVHEIMGNVFFASHDDEGNTISLTDKQITMIKEMFRYRKDLCVVR